MEKFKKVLAGNMNVRYIDNKSNWWYQHFNGKFTKSKPMPIIKVYGEVELNVVDEGVYGLRITSDPLMSR